MIEETREWQVTCDSADIEAAAVSRACWGAGPRLSSLDAAVADAEKEGFVAFPDGKHHLCRECAKTNRGLLVDGAP